jgi:hypothetical protein
MNNEPAAWTDGKGNYFDKHSFFPVNDLTPLYTHPADLTDEEIDECLYATDWSYDPHSFARAILRKAQEK